MARINVSDLNPNLALIELDADFNSIRGGIIPNSTLEKLRPATEEPVISVLQALAKTNPDAAKGIVSAYLNDQNVVIQIGGAG
ncbi:hypothetical protein IFO70_30315 [Phormidium tenue FACHB-886]|nr:hypothetical protein [Phormidium tenue FACHB-886]